MVFKWASNKTSLSHPNGEASESFQTDASQSVSYDTGDITMKNLAEVYNQADLLAGSWIDLNLLSPNSAFHPEKTEFTLQPREQTRIFPLCRQKKVKRGEGGRGWAEWAPFQLPFLLNSPGNSTPTLPSPPQTHPHPRTGKAEGESPEVFPQGGPSLYGNMSWRIRSPVPSASWIWSTSLQFCSPDSVTDFQSL